MYCIPHATYYILYHHPARGGPGPRQALVAQAVADELLIIIIITTTTIILVIIISIIRIIDITIAIVIIIPLGATQRDPSASYHV